MSEERPTLVYDDDCGVCTWAAEWITDHGEVEIVGFSELGADRIDRLPEDWRECAHLLVDGEVYSCGEAMEEAFLLTDDDGAKLLRVARELPGYGRVRDRAYRFFADHRGWFGSLVP